MFKKFTAMVMILMLVLSVAACAGPTPAATTAATTTKPAGSATAAPTTAAPTTPAPTTTAKAKLKGDVIVDGSGTVYPLMANIAEQYMTKEQTGVSVQVGRAGSSAGIKKFIPGEIDLADASRAIKQEEIDQMAAKGLVYATDVLEIMLAYDGLTMVINPKNTWAVEMTKDEIVNMYLSGKYKADDKVLWSDIRASWPKEAIKFMGPNENHGTYEFFYEVILGKKTMVKTANLQQEYSTLVDLVSNDINAIAFFGYGYYASNKAKLVAVKIDFGKGPIAPTPETIGLTLPYAGFTRPVFTYVNLKYAAQKPQVLDFAKYIVKTGAKELASKNGFAPLPDDLYKANLDKLNKIG